MEVIEAAVAAIERGDWSGLRLLLHPYVRWTGADGQTIRGRKKVLARLDEAPPTGPPRSHELRDGQIYLWTE